MLKNTKKLYYKKGIWENSNIIGDEFIECSHADPNTHKETLLTRVNFKTGQRTPILRDWCKDNKYGLEDAYWLKNIFGWTWLAAEAKPYDHINPNNIHNDQIDIAVFRAKDGTNNWQRLFSITPIGNGFQKASVSSPTFRFVNGILEFVYEGRPGLNVPEVDEYRTGYLEINPQTFQVSNRSVNPIISDRLVPDDFIGNKISGHRQDVPRQGKWLSVVYKKVSGVWVKDFEPKDQDGRVVEYHFNGYYFKNRGQELWSYGNSASPQPKPPTTNGGDVKPQIELNNDKLKVTNPVTGEKYAWQVKYISGRVEWFKFSYGSEEVAVRDQDKEGGNKFWCYLMSNKSALSNTVVYGGVVDIPDDDPPPTNGIDIVKIREHAQAILDLTE